ncbi:MAG: hypothetical protein OXU20_34820 [Myxococcales bacterium]|nr:hypothetical protein [Myxococcales bacterium]MDD9966844.1 hypothetical protein [Myxococcales bacterium]
MHTKMYKKNERSLGARLAVAALALAATCAIATPCPRVRADDAALTKFSGNYIYAADKAHGEAIIDKAIDKALSELGSVMKMMAKKAMSMNPRQKFMDKVWIDTPGGQIGLKIGDLDKIVLKPGKPKTMERDGRKAKVMHDFKGGKVIQTVEGERGAIKNTFTLASDGKTLHRDVVITSPRLQQPITYRLTYKRK